MAVWQFTTASKILAECPVLGEKGKLLKELFGKQTRRFGVGGEGREGDGWYFRAVAFPWGSQEEMPNDNIRTRPNMCEVLPLQWKNKPGLKRDTQWGRRARALCLLPRNYLHSISRCHCKGVLYILPCDSTLVGFFKNCHRYGAVFDEDSSTSFPTLPLWPLAESLGESVLCIWKYAWGGGGGG